jgi:hypothetical protein
LTPSPKVVENNPDRRSSMKTCVRREKRRQYHLKSE